MKDTKRRYEVFSFMDYTGIAAHLTEMAEKGWFIEKLSNFGWTYRKIEPKKMTFYISYFPKASEFDPEPTEAQKTFYDFCGHTGWELAATSAQMQIFYNERENPVPIETDPVVEVETIYQAAKKNFFPAHIVLLLLSVWNGFLFVSRLLEDPIGLLSSASYLFSGFAFTMVFLVCVAELSAYFIWYAKAKKAAVQGKFVKAYGTSRLQRIILAAVFMGYIYWIISEVILGSALKRTVGTAMIFYTAALIILVNAFKQSLKRKNVPRNVNRILTISSSFILSFYIMGVITFSVFRAIQNGFFDRYEESSEHNGATLTDYIAELPLTVEDMLDIQYDRYIKERRGDESLLVGQFVMQQFPRFETEYIAEIPELRYTITEVKLPLLYEFCKESLLNAGKDEQVDGQHVSHVYYEPVDPVPWQAEEVYRLYWSDGYYFDRYLLCYERRIVEITFGWEPTDEQIAIAADKLSGE